MGFIADTNIFNLICDGKIEVEELSLIGKLYASHVQRDELNKTDDPARKEKLLSTFCEITAEILPTESFVLDTSRLDYARLGNGESYQQIMRRLGELNGGKENNIEDALIGELAQKCGFTLLTTDRDLRTVISELGGAVRFYRYKDGMLEE